jgi:hypothetical protein
LYFFVSHFAIASAVHWFTASPPWRNAVLRHAAAGLGVCALASAPWAVLVSLKAGRPTPATTGSFNYRLVGPQSPGYPQYGRMIPPAAHAVSMWEQPDPALLPAWNPLASAAELKHQAKIAALALKELIRVTLETSLLAPAILLIYPLLGISGRLGGAVRWPVMLSLVLWYPAGYLLVLVQDRYLSGPFLLLLLMSAQIAAAALRTEALAPLARKALLAALFGSFLILPVRQFVGQRHTGRDIYQLSRSIASLHPVRGNLAACARWNDSLLLSYFLGGRFYGTTGLDPLERGWNNSLIPGLAARAAPPLTPGNRVDAELAGHGIDYYLVWSSCAGPIPDLPEVTGGRLRELRIYRVGEAP